MSDTTTDIETAGARAERYMVRAKRSTLIAYGQRGVSAAVNIAQLVVLSRLLTPAEYGIAAIALTITNFLAIVRDLGLSSSIIYQTELDVARRDALFWVNAAVTAICAIVMLSSAPLLSTVFRQPIAPMLVVLAASFMLTSLTSQHAATLRRELAFVPIAISDLSGILVGATVAISLAAFGFGGWSVIWGALAQAAISAAFYLKLGGWVPHWPKQFRSHRNAVIFGFGAGAFQILSYLVYNVPQLTVGYLYDAATVGQFSRALQLVMFPLTFVLLPFMAVQFPLLCRVSDNEDLTRRIYHWTLVITTITFVPMGLISLISADDIVAVLFGPQWAASGHFLRAFSLTIMGFCVLGPFSHYLISQGRVRTLAGWGGIDLAVRGGAAVAGSLISPFASALGFGLASLFFCAPVSVYISGRRGPFNVRQHLAALLDGARVAIPTGLAALAGKFASTELPAGIHPALKLAVIVGPAALVWVVILVFIAPQIIRRPSVVAEAA